MNPQRPYLLRALYQWIVDSDEVPYLLVDATVDGVQVPSEHVQDGQIVLNIGANAIRDLSLGDEFAMFSSRFNGAAMEIVLPMASIRAIYCKDSGEGMVFPEEEYGTRNPVVGSAPASEEPKPVAVDTDEKPTLRLV